jgi:tRNA-modifying protein YgfZ
MSSSSPLQIAARPRGFVGVRGPEAESYLQRMLSNDIEALGIGDSCDALLLTPRGRVIAPTVVWRRAVDDFLLLTEPRLDDVLRRELVRSRFATKVEIEIEVHRSVLVFGEEAPRGAVANRDYGVPAYELVDLDPPEGKPIADEALERLRILARTPRYGLEVDESVLPAEAGLDDRAVSFTKGCYPGQEPVARLHYRGHPNRTLRVLAFDEGDPPEGAELTFGGKVVGRVTSVARDDGSGFVALAYVRREVPADAALDVGSRTARQLDLVAARP